MLLYLHRFIDTKRTLYHSLVQKLTLTLFPLDIFHNLTSKS